MGRQKNVKTKISTNNNKKYKIKAIKDNSIYSNKRKNNLPGFYYFIV